MATGSGGHVFGKGFIESPLGATSVIIPGRIGVEHFWVVRAVDTNGLEDENTVELSITPVTNINAAYVDVTNTGAGGGTGTVDDPFTSLQDGINLAQAFGLPGGIVLVAAGSYNEHCDIDSGGAGVINVMGGFPSFETIGGGSPTGLQLLQANDPTVNEVTISGTGIDQFNTDEEGLIRRVGRGG